MADPVECARRSYAEEICLSNGVSSPAILAAFASVPRERFLGPGPWLVQGEARWHVTPDANPAHVYRDVLIVLDEAKRLNNGQPSLWAIHLEPLSIRHGDTILHLGCGTGYYTAILAELTGRAGKVTALEIEEGLAARARRALAPWPQVTVLHADGSRGPFHSADVIVVSAGATHPLPAWLEAVKPAGRLLFPLTPTRGPGTMAHLARVATDIFAAALRGQVSFVEFGGARDAAVSEELARALHRDAGAGVRSLRCEPHPQDESCWLHGNGWCFSRLAPGAEAEMRSL